MSWRIFNPLTKREITAEMGEDEKLLRAYLENESDISYGDHSLEGTVRDVLALDEDLRAYVMAFVRDGAARETEIKCECVSIGELLATERFTPITAALLIQWYRKDPLNAARFLLHHDDITDIPAELPPEEEGN